MIDGWIAVNSSTGTGLPLVEDPLFTGGSAIRKIIPECIVVVFTQWKQSISNSVVNRKKQPLFRTVFPFSVWILYLSQSKVLLEHDKVGFFIISMMCGQFECALKYFFSEDAYISFYCRKRVTRHLSNPLKQDENRNRCLHCLDYLDKH